MMLLNWKKKLSRTLDHQAARLTTGSNPGGSPTFGVNTFRRDERAESGNPTSKSYDRAREMTVRER